MFCRTSYSGGERRGKKKKNHNNKPRRPCEARTRTSCVHMLCACAFTNTLYIIYLYVYMNTYNTRGCVSRDTRPGQYCDGRTRNPLKYCAFYRRRVSFVVETCTIIVIIARVNTTGVIFVSENQPPPYRAPHTADRISEIRLPRVESVSVREFSDLCAPSVRPRITHS